MCYGLYLHVDRVLRSGPRCYADNVANFCASRNCVADLQPDQVAHRSANHSLRMHWRAHVCADAHAHRCADCTDKEGSHCGSTAAPTSAPTPTTCGNYVAPTMAPTCVPTADSMTLMAADWSCASFCCDSYSCDDVKGMSKGCASSCSLSMPNIHVKTSYGRFCIIATTSLSGARPYSEQNMVGLELLLAGLGKNLACGLSGARWPHSCIGGGKAGTVPAHRVPPTHVI